MNNKLFYETPMTELILVHFEENIMSDIQNVPTAPKFNGSYGEETSWD